MALRTWVKLLAATMGVGALAGAGQLGVAYGLGLVRLTRVLDVTARDQWTAQLGWAAWLAMSAAVIGALVGWRLLPRTASPETVLPDGLSSSSAGGSTHGPADDPSRGPADGRPESSGDSPSADGPSRGAGDRPVVRRLSVLSPTGGPAGLGTFIGLAVAAGLGASVVVPLTMQPARAATVAGIDPVFLIGLSAALGALTGIFAAYAAVTHIVARRSLVIVGAAIWAIALASLVPTLSATDPLPAVRLGVFDPGSLSAAVTQRTALFTMPALALLIGAALGYLARREERSTLTIALAGLPGPALLTVAYLIAGPGSGTHRYQVVPYWAAMTATGAGVLGSVLAAIIRRGGEADGATRERIGAAAGRTPAETAAAPGDQDSAREDRTLTGPDADGLGSQAAGLTATDRDTRADRATAGSEPGREAQDDRTLAAGSLGGAASTGPDIEDEAERPPFFQRARSLPSIPRRRRGAAAPDAESEIAAPSTLPGGGSAQEDPLGAAGSISEPDISLRPTDTPIFEVTASTTPGMRHDEERGRESSFVESKVSEAGRPASAPLSSTPGSGSAGGKADAPDRLETRATDRRGAGQPGTPEQPVPEQRSAPESLSGFAGLGGPPETADKPKRRFWSRRGSSATATPPAGPSAAQTGLGAAQPQPTGPGAGFTPGGAEPHLTGSRLGEPASTEEKTDKKPSFLSKLTRSKQADTTAPTEGAKPAGSSATDVDDTRTPDAKIAGTGKPGAGPAPARSGAGLPPFAPAQAERRSMVANAFASRTGEWPARRAPGGGRMNPETTGTRMESPVAPSRTTDLSARTERGETDPPAWRSSPTGSNPTGSRPSASLRPASRDTDGPQDPAGRLDPVADLTRGLADRESFNGFATRPAGPGRVEPSRAPEPTATTRPASRPPVPEPVARPAPQPIVPEPATRPIPVEALRPPADPGSRQPRRPEPSIPSDPIEIAPSWASDKTDDVRPARTPLVPEPTPISAPLPEPEPITPPREQPEERGRKASKRRQDEDFVDWVSGLGRPSGDADDD